MYEQYNSTNNNKSFLNITIRLTSTFHIIYIIFIVLCFICCLGLYMMHLYLFSASGFSRSGLFEICLSILVSVYLPPYLSTFFSDYFLTNIKSKHLINKINLDYIYWHKSQSFSSPSPSPSTCSPGRHRTLWSPQVCVRWDRWGSAVGFVVTLPRWSATHCPKSLSGALLRPKQRVWHHCPLPPTRPPRRPHPLPALTSTPSLWSKMPAVSMENAHNTQYSFWVADPIYIKLRLC